MPQPEPPKLDPIRKAAILISTLDHRVADELLERMPPDKAALVRSVAMELDDISEEEQRLVMREFLGSSDADDDAEESGVELDEELARKLASHENFVETPRASSEQEEPPFRFLRDAEADAIAKHLQHENPQIIAVVIAHLPPRQAADLLKHFDPQLQASLLRRIAELDSTDPDIVREVEKHLKMRLHDDLRAAKNRAHWLVDCGFYPDGSRRNSRTPDFKSDTTRPPTRSPVAEPDKRIAYRGCPSRGIQPLQSRPAA